MNWPWSELSLPGPADLSEVRRAYAERLKTTHPEENPEGFQRLHEAYQQARRQARKGGEAAGRQQAPPQPREREERQEEPRWEDDMPAAPEDGEEDEPEAEEPDWDFDAIFAQQAAQRAAERERQAGERRDAYFARHQPATPAERERLEEQWPRVDRALAAVEELHASGAPLYVWTSFFNSGAFFSVKGDEDFVVGLEEFLRRTPELDGQVKAELIKVFNLRQTHVPSLWLGLQELLVERAPSGREEPEKARPKKGAWTARMKTWTRGQRIAWWIVMTATVSLLSILIPLGAFSDMHGGGRAGIQQRELLCRYMEEDFGRAVESHWKGRDNYENLYAPWDQPDLLFMTWPEGERDLAAGRRGYTTNYSNVMVTQALKDFAEDQGWELALIQEGGCDGVMGAYGTSPGSYVLRLPLTGGGEGIAALGRLLDELAAKSWYHVFPPSFQMILAYHDLTYYTYASDEPFEAEAVREYYENEAGAALCAFLTEESGLAREDFGGDGYELEPQGPVELDGKTYFLVSGLNAASGETARQYLFDGVQLVSLPAEKFSLDMKAYQLMGDRFNSAWADMPRYIWISRK